MFSVFRKIIVGNQKNLEYGIQKKTVFRKILPGIQKNFSLVFRKINGIQKNISSGIQKNKFGIQKNLVDFADFADYRFC